MKFDYYSFKARLQPGFIVLLPLGLALAAWLPTQVAAWKPLASLGAYCGLGVLLAEMGRDLGRKKQSALYLKWGGAPTTRLLRHRDTHLDPVSLGRYHSFLSMAINHRLPSQPEEERDNVGADKVYESAVRFLLEATRDKSKFPLVLKENISYGFRRNLWGMKPAAIGISTLGLAACLIPLVQALWAGSTLPPLPFAMSICNVILLVLWLLRVTPSWVLTAADAYALRLLAACDQLAVNKETSQQRLILTR